MHTDAVKEYLIPKHVSKSQINSIYADEADVLNVALFGMTANVTQLVCLAGLESLNAELIREGLPQGERLRRLNKAVIAQMRSLEGHPSIKKLESK